MREKRQCEHSIFCCFCVRYTVI